MKKNILLTILISLIVMPVVGYSADNQAANMNQSTTQKKKPLYWIDTMEPNIHYSAPGKSRMGMDLVPVYTEEKKQ